MRFLGCALFAMVLLQVTTCAVVNGDGCPEVLKWMFGPCVQGCNTTDPTSCPADKMCCLTSCGTTCVTPEG